ncbi:MAG: hypothetical protein AB7V47_00120 [Phycisphaerales bacterium]
MVATGAVVACTASAAHAQSIPVVNHGFEANFAAPNSFPVLIPAGWQLFDPGTIVEFSVDAVGVLNPTNSTYFPAGAPEGSNVALIYLDGDRGTTPVGLQQTVDAVLESGATYTLAVQVGNIASGVGAPPFDFFFDLDGFPGYAVQLLAGGEVIAEDHNSMGVGAARIPEGEFRLSTVTFTPEAGHPRVGQALGVRLMNLNMIDAPQNPGIEVDFDDVQLTVTRCGADFNADGSLDPDDLGDYINCYFGVPSCDGADFNADGSVDPDDLGDFINAYFAGCA